MITESIKRVNGYEKNPYTYYHSIIVGARASGIAAACQLKAQLGFDQLRVFGRQTGIGGTWWINRYSDVSCDIPAIFNSFSFAQNSNWSSFHPPGKEIVQYYNDVCEKYQVTEKFELNTDIQSCRWLDNEALWEVTLCRLVAGMGDISSKDPMKIVQEKGKQAVYAETQVVKAKVVLSCVGGLVEPKAFPKNIKGIKTFKGKIFHSARWDNTANLTDKNFVVSLRTQPLSRITETGVVVGLGASYPANAKKADYPEREIPADIIVHADGFDTTRWLHPLKVIGKERTDIVEAMEERGGAQAYQGTAVDGFPNFMMIFGPNTVTGHSSVLMASENMVNYSINFIRLILTHDARTFDVNPEAEKAYTAQVQRAVDNTVWNSGCSSWYFTDNGWNSTVYPYSQVFFWYRCLFAKWSDWNIEYTHEGLVIMRIRRMLRMSVSLLVVYGAWKLSLHELGLREWKYLGRIVAQGFMQNAMQLGERTWSSIRQ
ncbi:hypothetical protein COCVIDRAFT_17688 [Bipolaris victoriae FI3]|uniref:FAD/NAD(P)-binding domain-containing protein n=1 Tax=Bipolaris victoriae (strain FI3) TaxID=930091 RepID=W7EA97_BIPV3|nr:hypothetical protein COCVIDRAFT_17688 [Bipolaris victoriae FI3]